MLGASGGTRNGTRSPQHTAFLEELSWPELRSQVIIDHDGGKANRALDLWPVLERPARLIPLLQAAEAFAKRFGEERLHSVRR
jgi:hypothetical protein